MAPCSISPVIYTTSDDAAFSELSSINIISHSVALFPSSSIQASDPGTINDQRISIDELDSFENEGFFAMDIGRIYNHL